MWFLRLTVCLKRFLCLSGHSSITFKKTLPNCQSPPVCLCQKPRECVLFTHLLLLCVCSVDSPANTVSPLLGSSHGVRYYWIIFNMGHKESHQTEMKQAFLFPSAAPNDRTEIGREGGEEDWLGARLHRKINMLTAVYNWLASTCQPAWRLKQSAATTGGLAKACFLTQHAPWCCLVLLQIICVSSNIYLVILQPPLPVFFFSLLDTHKWKLATFCTYVCFYLQNGKNRTFKAVNLEVIHSLIKWWCSGSQLQPNWCCTTKKNRRHQKTPSITNIYSISL